MRRAKLCMMLVVLAVLASGASASAISATWSFDSDNQGWSENQTELQTDNTPATWSHGLFEFGGHLGLTDTFATSTIPFGEAVFWSPTFTGDYTAAYGGTLSVDLRFDTAWGTGFFPYISITDGNGTGVQCAFSSADVPADNVFHRITATLTEADNPGCTWKDGFGNTITTAAFKAILSHLSVILVSADSTPATGDKAYLDNVRLIGPPETTITSAPAGIVSGSSATIAFASDPATGTTFQCQVDGGAFAPCTSPDTLTGLTDGAHTFAVRSLIGTIVDATPATTAFAIDTRPIVAVTPPPIAPSVPPPVVITPKLQNVTLSGSSLLYTASGAGTMTITVTRRTSGHKKKGKHCSSLTKHGAGCTYYKAVLSSTKTIRSGAGRVSFGRSALKKGSYRVTVVLTIGRKKSAPVVKAFTVK